MSNQTIQSIQSILDFKATLLSTTGYTAMLTGVVALFWFYNRKERALLTLGIGGAIAAGGTLLAYLPPLLAPWPMLVLDTLLLLLFHPLALIATQQMFGRPCSWPFTALSVAVVMLAFVYWGGMDGYGRRVMVTSGAHLLYWIMVIRLLWRQRRQATPAGHRLALGLAAAITAIAACRWSVAWYAGDPGFGQRCAMFNLFTSLGLFWTTFCFSLSMLFISYERLLLQVKLQAQQDGLTRLYNHRTFHEKAEGLFMRAHARREPLALLLIDLDHFKRINDCHGHQAGDEVLRQLADCLRGETRHGDLLGRHGGEEFVALLPQTARIEAYNMADRLRRAIANLKPVVGACPLSISASIGVASLRADEHANLASLFLEADVLLYQAKHKGRNRVEMEREAAAG
ncbi:GGDEF domain-containing protein [Chromobacterium sphagni]|uniref:diguanylate cyclase n=1 Tax=Chromobacterium sphagni TaxID=1903179 RepID=A0A1S1X3U3_9NEIS|nr:GGDEF domain-containing protein [Chromobacterium sphagni]OHX14090.1 hypothetical protein BI347_11655 [Chromobacterium sphagni]OHX20297.1 hypothetical protein BI344_07355 [Chromobacterium sphagni]